MRCYLVSDNVGSKKGHRQGAWDDKSMKLACNAVIVNKWSESKAAKSYGVSRQTLRRKLSDIRQGKGVVKKKGGPNCYLTPEQEDELCDLILEMEARLYGLTISDVRVMVYEFCKKNSIPNKFSEKDQKAGKKWMRGFLKRHSNLSLRKPEPTSIQRAIGFNRSKVDRFYEVLQSTLFNADGSRKIPPNNLYNVDESGFTICQAPRKIIAKKGKRTVGMLTSAEKGKTITVISCISATGVFVPPAFIFPRVRMKLALTDKLPEGNLALASKSGWVNEELFSQWFDHFLNVVQPQARPQPSLLIFDGHTSHVRNANVIVKARENNVSLLMLPSHCTHRLQPLDIAVFKSLSSHYDERARVWLKNHPGRAISELEFGEIFSEAYGLAASVKNAVSGFRAAGIHPYDPHRFHDDDYLGCAATDKDQNAPAVTAQLTKAREEFSDTVTESESTPSTSVEPATGEVTVTESEPTPSTSVEPAAGDVTVTESESTPSTSVEPAAGDVTVTESEPIPSTSVEPTAAEGTVTESEPTPSTTVEPAAGDVTVMESQPTPSTSVKPTAGEGKAQRADTRVNFKALITLPKAESRPASSKRKRAVAHATVVTCSPYLKELQSANAKKAAAELRKESRRLNCGARQNLSRKFESVEKVAKKQNVKRKKKGNHNVEGAKKIKNSSTKRGRGGFNEDVGCSVKNRRKKKKVNTAVDDHQPCQFCGKRYNTKEDDKPEDDWFECVACKQWVHETCAEQAGVIGDDEFICKGCVA